MWLTSNISLSPAKSEVGVYYASPSPEIPKVGFYRVRQASKLPEERLFVGGGSGGVNLGVSHFKPKNKNKTWISYSGVLKGS